MHSDRSSRVFIVWLVLCALVAMAGCFWLLRLRTTARSAVRLLAEKEAESAGLRREESEPPGKNEQMIEVDLARRGRDLAALRVGLHDEGDPAPGAERPIDAYFALASTVEQLRAVAVRQHVLVKPNERFGFGAFAHEGPAPVLLSVVERQRRVIEELVESVLAAGPRELLEVRRERPKESAPARKPTVSAAGGMGHGDEATDYFTPDPRLEIKSPGVIEPWMFRLEFIGQTPALRAFLDNIADSPLPLIVRSVEVEPGPAVSGRIGRSGPSAVPLIGPIFSRIAVVVEFVELTGSENIPAP
jgi:hypothetical protein